MPAISRDQVVAALAETLRERLLARKPAHVPGLGTFSINHTPSEVGESEGEMVLTAPRDYVAFEPEEKN